jgi:hypothetical protein
MSNEIQYAIYAAPRARDGRYRFCKERPLLRKPFQDRTSMASYWDTVIVPATGTTAGADYEFAMVQARGGDWAFIGPPRYADDTLLTGDDVTKDRRR